MTEVKPPLSEEQPYTYHGLTKTGTYSFLSALPLFLLYEIMILTANDGRISQIRVSSEVWIKQVLALLGATELRVLGALVLLLGVGILLYERKKKIPIRFRYFVGIFFESICYAVLVAVLVSQVVGTIFYEGMALTGQESPLDQQSMGLKLALSIGAGLYEELLFRVLLVGGMAAVFRVVFRTQTVGYVLAALIGAFVFSGIHYIGTLGDPFTLPSFSFRFLFGLALNVLYLVRGFGVAAWTHALYDIMIVTNMLG